MTSIKMATHRTIAENDVIASQSGRSNGHAACVKRLHLGSLQETTWQIDQPVRPATQQRPLSRGVCILIDAPDDPIATALPEDTA